MKNPFTKSSESFDYINKKMMDYLSNDEHVKVTIERTRFNSISNRWETKSIEVQEYDVNSYDLVLIAISNKFRLI